MRPRDGVGSLGLVTNGAERTRWKIRGDGTVDKNPAIGGAALAAEAAALSLIDEYRANNAGVARLH